MTEVLLFHHAHGQTAGFLAFADALRRAGHSVHAPDLYNGRTFDTLDEGVVFAGEIGFGEIIERGVRAADELPRGSCTPASRWGCCRRRSWPRPARGRGGAAVPLVCADVGVRVLVAGGRTGAGPRDGGRPVLRGRG